MDLDQVIIKNFEKEDVDSLRSLADVLNAREDMEVALPDHLVELILSKDDMRKDIFLAYCDNQVVGFAGCMRNSPQSKSANFNLMLHPDYRRQGLGQKLYDIILERAKEHGLTKARTFVKKSISGAVEFAERRGFEVKEYLWKMDLPLKNIKSGEAPKEKYSIRKLTLEDAKCYADIMNAGFKKEGEELYTEKSFENNFKNPDAEIFFVEQDGNIVATAAITIERELNRGFIYNVTVYKDYRGRGFGEITLNHCIKLAMEAGVERASLGVDGVNSNALNLYKKLGFVETDTNISLEKQLDNVSA